MENDCSKLKKDFLDELRAFHLEQGTPFKKLMKFNGKDVDLYVLYNTVTELGGWESLNSKDGWGVVQVMMDFPNKCVNVKIALKRVYMRYLDSYERCFFNRKKFSESYKHGKKEARDLAMSLHPVPLRYNYNQHFISDTERISLGLTKDDHCPRKFGNLALSLICPLPNEHDFAINICLFLSLQPDDFQVYDEPRIIHYLLAHAGVFKNNSLECLFNDICLQHRFSSFWKDTLDYHKINDSLLVYLKELFPFLKQNLSNDTSDVLQCNDIALKRILNIATIFNNLTFNELNNNFIAQDSTSLTFVIMCCISNVSILNTLGWSILSNISEKFIENNDVLNLIIQLCNISIEKNQYKLFALEVLTNVIRNINDLEPLITYMSSDFLKLLLNLLSQKDVVLTMRILDFLFYFTGASPVACDCLLSVPGSLVSLIQLLSIVITNEECSWGEVKIVEEKVESGQSVNYNCKYSEIFRSTNGSVCPEFQFDHLTDNSIGKNIDCYDTPENDLINESLINMCTSFTPERTEIDNGLMLNQGKDVAEKLEIPCKDTTIDNSLEIIQPPQSLGTITLTPLLITGSTLLANPIIVGNQMIFLANPLNGPSNNLTITQLYYTQFQPGDVSAVDINDLENNQCSESMEIASSSGESTNDDSLLIDLDKVNLMEVEMNGSPPKSDVFICEWRGCMRNFKTCQQLYRHACKLHCPKSQLKQRCRWFKCVDMERSQYSMMVHLLKSHCNKNLKRIMNKSETFWTNKRMMAAGKKESQCLTKNNISDFNRVHDGIAKEQLKIEDNQKDKEDQLTKSVRLTSAMVIKNVAVNSDNGRKQLKCYELSLLNIAISNCESSKVIADVLSII